MATGRITLFDLIYFCGERLWDRNVNKVIPAMVDGSMWLSAAFIVPAALVVEWIDRHCMSLGQAGIYISIFLAPGLPFAVAYVVYHRRQRKARVMAHYRNSFYDNDIISGLVLAAWVGFSILLSVLVKTIW